MVTNASTRTKIQRPVESIIDQNETLGLNKNPGVVERKIVNYFRTKPHFS